MTTPGVEPGLSRPQRDILTTRRCGLLAAQVGLQLVQKHAETPSAMRLRNHANSKMATCLWEGAEATQSSAQLAHCERSTSDFCANQQGNGQCDHQRCNSNICDCCSLRLFKDIRHFANSARNCAGEIKRALLGKCPSYLASASACHKVAILTVDCTCTGSLLQ